MADPLSLCIRSYKRKKALKRLSQLKENAVREHMGLPPKKSWYVDFVQIKRAKN
jgi:hypothetical protein